MYGYANGDPISYSDPYGLNPCANLGYVLRSICDRAVETALGAAEGVARTVSGAMSLLPGFGDANDAGTVLTGRDVLFNERVGPGGRIAAAAGFVSPVGNGRLVREGGDRLFRAISNFIGENGRAFQNRAGDLIVQSEDQLREVRFDFNNYQPHAGPHVHVVEYEPTRGGKREVFNQRIPEN